MNRFTKKSKKTLGGGFTYSYNTYDTIEPSNENVKDKEVLQQVDTTPSEQLLKPIVKSKQSQPPKEYYENSKELELNDSEDIVVKKSIPPKSIGKLRILAKNIGKVVKGGIIRKF